MRKSANIKSCDFIFRDFLFLHFRKSPNPRSMCHRSAAQTSGTAVPKLPDNRCGISSYTTLCQAGTAALNLPTSRWIGCASIFAVILRNFVTPAHKGNAFPFEHKNQLTQIFMLYPGLNLKTSFSIERGLLRPLRKM